MKLNNFGQPFEETLEEAAENDTKRLWKYVLKPEPVGDCRKIVTLVQDGMSWVGIRAFDHQNQRWLNNNEPETALVVAWRDLDEPAQGRLTRDHAKYGRSLRGAEQPRKRKRTNL